MKRFVPAMTWYRVSLMPLLVLLLLLISTQGFADDERYMKINRSIELFGRVYQEIINNYVDAIDPELFIRAGIDGMLGVLDPYTVYIDEHGRDEVNMLTTGRYGGIGITIGMYDGQVTVSSITDGYSAEKQGLRIGDRIVTIDSMAVEGLSLGEIRSMVRGEPGSTVHLVVERDQNEEMLAFTLVRESIRVTNISYADFIDDGIVYLRLDRFSRGAGGETRQTLRNLLQEETIRGVILDLRNNSGGLLDAAVEVTNLFVPRGTLIVSTHGRTGDSVRRYVASQEPLLPDIPLIVLINENSASASEIVAGAIQDLDRGVLVGTRSFGKGLVQTVAHLTSDAQLKITTSRYYTPSGRSIQTSDYLSTAPKGLFEFHTDSLHTEYKTDAGRTVYEGKGITPDSIVSVPEQSRYLGQLHQHAMIFQFVTRLMNSETYADATPSVDVNVVEQFSDFLHEKGFRYKELSEERIEELREIAAAENYSQSFSETLTALERYISNGKTDAFDRHRDEIARELAAEINSRHEGMRGRIETELASDPQFITAVGLIKDKPLYQHQLTTAK
jgi:carboxyl-terminal processing protease